MTNHGSVLALSFVAACSGRSFTPEFPEAGGSELAPLIDQLTHAPARPTQAIIVGVGGNPSELFAWDLRENRVLWTRPVEAKSAPAIAAPYAVTHEGEAIVARNLTDGTRAFGIDAGGRTRLIGADADGASTVISYATGPDETPHGRVVLARNGAVQWTYESDLPIGVVAVSGGLVVVPWATQRLSFVDASSGSERARVEFRDAVVGHAFVGSGSVWVGQHGVFRVTPAIESGRRADASYYEPRARHLPGQPPLLRDGYQAIPTPDSASHRVRLLWQPEASGETLGARAHTLVLLFYRFLFGFDSEADELRWVFESPVDIAGATMHPGGIFTVGADGSLSLVSLETGVALWSGTMGRPVEVAAVSADAWPIPPSAPPATPALADQLFAAASMNDARLAEGRAMAVRYLSRDESAEVTERLIGLCASAHSPEPVRLASCAAVAERTAGQLHVQAALRRHASFLEGEVAPPVGALALAAGKMRLRSVVPELLRHLEDPATPSREIAGIMEGLARLRARSAASSIEDFLRLYHGDTGDPDLIAGLGAAADALAIVRQSTAKPLLARLAEDPLTGEPLRARLRAAITAIDAPPLPEPEEPAEPEPPPPPPPPEPDTRPVRINVALTANVFDPVRPRLLRCMPDETRTARLALLVQPDGTIHTVTVTPSAMQECIEPLVRRRSFPATRARGLEQVSYTLAR